MEPESHSAVSKALIRLLGDPERARAMGRAGRKMVEQEFSIDAMVEGNLQVYRRICGAGAA